jgi:aerobic carbon-monoxide dehydrogenase medium subunit
MYPKSFEYTRAESIDQAIELLGQYGEDAKLLAGGASLIPLMKLRLASPTHLIDISRLSGLAGVRRENGTIVIGPMTRHRDLERDAELCAALPIIYDAASKIGDTQVRNMGTIGGSLGEADPAGDWAPVALALGAELTVKGSAGQRSVPVSELFLDAYTTSLEHDELITEVRLPAPGERFGAAHLKIERRAGDYAIANCSVALSLGADDKCQSIRIGLGAVGLFPLRVAAAEELISGQVLTDDLLGEAQQLVANCTESYGDARGGEDYRRHLGGVMFRRAVDVARRRARGEQVETGHGH